MPVKSFSYGLDCIFDDWQMPERLYQEGLDEIVDYFAVISSKYRQRIAPPEGVLNRLGYMTLKEGDHEEAIRIFKLNAENYPRSANVFDSLGEAFLVSGDSANAVTCYERSLELNPDNKNARTVLMRLQSAE